MKRIMFGIVGTFIFYGLMVGLTKLSSAENHEVPITPPITPPSSTDGHSTGGVKAKWDDDNVKLNFNAHGGTEVKGNVTYVNSDGTSFKGNVNVCYYQSGDEAAFAGTVKSGTASEEYFLVKVQDNGEGKNADPDMLGVWLTDIEPPCTLGGYPAMVEKGNLQVH